MESKIYNPIQGFQKEFLEKQTKIGGSLETFSESYEIKEFLDDFTKEFTKKIEEVKGFNHCLYGIFYSNILEKKKINIDEKSYLYHYYVFKMLKEKLAKREDYNQVVIDLEYAEPFRYNLGYYEEKIREIFNNFVYMDNFDYMNHIKKIDVKFVNTEYYDDEDDE